MSKIQVLIPNIVYECLVIAVVSQKVLDPLVSGFVLIVLDIYKIELKLIPRKCLDGIMLKAFNVQ